MLKYKLRTLFALVTIAGLGVWAAMWWQQRHYATITRLKPNSPEVALLVRKPRIRKEGKEYFATLHTRYRSSRFVYHAVNGPVTSRLDLRGESENSMYQEFEISSIYLEDLMYGIKECQKADFLHPNELVVAGLMQTRDGKPAPHLMIDLIGPELWVTHCYSRDDGTFIMPMPVRRGRYHLRIRKTMESKPGNETRSVDFWLDGKSREHLFLVTLKQPAPK